MRPFSGRERVNILDPVVEPFWSGERVIAHIDLPGGGGSARAVRLIDTVGADLAPGLARLSAALSDSIRATDAIVDGVISRQVFLSGIGTAPVPEVRTSQVSLLMRGRSEVDVTRHDGPAIDVTRHDGPAVEPDEAPDTIEGGGFVAVDLLRVDGTDLLDVPLLERKRLLESVVAESLLVRVSGHVRPPVETWVATWKSLGLRGGMLKAANSRYEPGEVTIEWRIVESVGRGR